MQATVCGIAKSWTRPSDFTFTFPIQGTFWTCLVAQAIKNLPSMQETQVGFLVEEDPLEEGLATHSSIPENCLENSMDRGAWQATVLAVGGD